MSRTPQSVFDALAAVKRRLAALHEADLLADRDDDIGDELADREEHWSTCDTTGVCWCDE